MLPPKVNVKPILVTADTSSSAKVPTRFVNGPVSNATPVEVLKLYVFTCAFILVTLTILNNSKLKHCVAVCLSKRFLVDVLNKVINKRESC